MTKSKQWVLSVATAALACLGAGEALAQTADLSVTKEAAAPAYGAGDTIVYEIIVSNAGPSTATGVVLDDIPPTGFGSPSAVSGSSCVSIPCNLGTINAASSKTVNVSYVIPGDWSPPTAIRNFAGVSATSTDPDEDEDWDAFAFDITPVEGINCGNLAVSTGDTHSCAVVAGKDPVLPSDLVECWGLDDNGQSSPPTGTFLQVSAGYSNSCGVTTGGSIQCWGDDFFGIVSGAPAGTNFTKVDLGLTHACALRSNNTVTCWGDDQFGKATAPADFFTDVAVGEVHSCGVKTNGTILCWGDDNDADGSGDPLVTGVPSFTDFVAVTAGGLHACGLRAGGSVDCWGTSVGCIGIPLGDPCDDETEDRTGPYSEVSAGAEHTCAVLAGSGLAECWGSDFFGQLSGIPPESFEAIDAGVFNTCGLLGDGDILCWGDNVYLQSTPPDRSDLCPVCLDGFPEGSEDPACDIAPPGTPPSCCSPVTCSAYRLSDAQVCRAGVSACDAPEICNGTSLSCPADVLAPSTTVCRLKVGSCDVEEKCTGSSSTCPPELPMLPNGTLCRANAGSCDFQEFCNGSSALCPADIVVTGGTLCRASAGVCDVLENCTGTSGVCPNDTFLSGNTCRSATGVCDVAETCSGSDAACPADAVASVIVACRNAIGVCDQVENCDGTAKTCPTDVLRPSITPCRAATGGCDAVERCTGSSVTCPADVIASAGTTCRASVGVCDVAETCGGSTKDCPADAVNPANTQVCRNAVDVCDVTETCTGSTPTCPANAFATSGTDCNDGAFCNGTDECNGSGACTLHAGNPCDGSDNDADCSEQCNELADDCSTNDPNGVACNDGDPCSTGETCSSGTCAGGTVTVCNDGNICTFDTCDVDEGGCVYLAGVADTGCLVPGGSMLLIRDTAVPGGDLLKWKWKKGEIIPPDELGSPDVDTDYTLCLYDRQGGSDSLVASYAIPADGTFWKKRSTKVKYVNKDASVEGVLTFKAKSVAIEGKSGAGLTAGGLTLELPTPAASNLYFFHEPSMIAQLRNEAGMCLSTEFFADDFKKNDADKVKAVTKF